MSDGTDRDDLPTEEEEPSQGEAPEQLPPTTPSDKEKVETVSLLDLMDGAGEDVTAPEPVEMPAPGLEVDADEATLTQAPQPAAPDAEEADVLPLDSEELIPQERPLERDQEATEVQPRVAFPERLRTISEEPTQIFEPVRQPKPAERDDAPHDDAPTIVRPRRQQSPARQPDRAPVKRDQAARQPVRQQRSARPDEPVKVVIPAKAKKQRPRVQTRRSRNWRGCFLRAVLLLLILIIAGFAFSVIGAAVAYTSIANDLPAPTELAARASDFETVRIYDRNGSQIYAQADPNTGNRTRVTLDQISPHLLEATIATEDARFYQNPGFDPVGIVRAVYQAAREREFVSGASTITQQLVRAVLLDEEERTERSFRRKLREIILAAELSRTYEKDEILELYLNEIYYGNLAYGIEAAAQTYFGKPAADLSLTEASLLAGLPQAPALWDPYTAPEKAIGRQWEVLSLMVEAQYITLQQAQAALNETNLFIYNLTPSAVTLKYPHFTFTVLQQAEDQLGAQSIYRGGLRIYTTLAPAAQQLAQGTIAETRANINAAGANNAALVAVQPGTGEILALVGSVDFNDEAIDGQVNMALAPRQPGSTIKPFVYLTAMERGWTPATLIWDVPTQFPNGVNPPYVPKNYDDDFHGPLRLRPALGNSYNIPAVKALEYVGICEFIDNVKKFGLSLQDDGCDSVNQPRDHGMSLALGGGELSPLEMAGAFNMLASQGRFIEPFAIARIENRQGEILFEHAAGSSGALQVVREAHAYLLSHILSDNDARQPEFGPNNNLLIPGHRVAAKTGTSGSTVSDVRDAWTIGFTPHIVTAVWVGNTGNEPLVQGASGYQVASPIWNRFMARYLADKQQMDFIRPPDVTEIEICADSGTRPGAACINRRLELFAVDQAPLESDSDFLQKVPIDLWTNLRATGDCPESVYEAGFFTLLVSGNESILDRERTVAKRWLEESAAGQRWAAARSIGLPLRLPPSESCDGSTPRPRVAIDQPVDGQEIIDVVEVRGTVLGPNVSSYRVEFGVSHDPGGWGLVQAGSALPIENGLLATWDTSGIIDYGPITLRVIALGPDNRYTEESDPVTLESRVLLGLLEPTPTPTTTPTETPTPTETGTPTETPTATGTSTSTPTLEPTTTTPVATDTATPTNAGATPTSTPSQTPGP